MSSTTQTVTLRRLRLDVRGRVQGVGFRPFVYRLAAAHGLGGWVRNGADGVRIEVEGAVDALDRFCACLVEEAPPLARVAGVDRTRVRGRGERSFQVRESMPSTRATTHVPPDVATCPDCRRELLDPSDRRYRYPFINCTNCGPRYTILETLPYDRAGTTMRHFPLCPACEREYRDPTDRRFHAQPTACPVCGPQLVLRDTDGRPLATADTALRQTAAAIREGRIVAVKGLGGFHLLADAASPDVVRELRLRKRRPEKPFAVLVPSLEQARELCDVGDVAAELLTSAAGPIVLVCRRAGSEARLAPELAPGNPRVGVMLPSNPIHHLLMDLLGTPIVATSGNRSDEPICIDDEEALRRLAGVADLFLGHDRGIVRPVDDSVVRPVLGRALVLRSARGYAPTVLPRPTTGPPALAVGAHQKSAVALELPDSVVVSQHLGDLDTPLADEHFRAAIASMESLFGVTPDRIVCDLHPDYRSSIFAEERSPARRTIQHHAAHVLSCAAEHGRTEPALGVAWDGTGLGSDGKIWGGEFFLVDGPETRRIAHWREFPLPGGERAAREPRRSALGWLHERFGHDVSGVSDVPTWGAFADSERFRLLAGMARGVGAPYTTSVGRLFDAVASLVGLRQRVSFEGQAAMELEFAAEKAGPCDPYPVWLRDDHEPYVLDWEPLLDGLLQDLRTGRTVEVLAGRFHATLVESIARVARRVDRRVVLLTGGCFQNALLLEAAAGRLEVSGREPLWPRLLPPNDGGIAYGQLAGREGG